MRKNNKTLYLLFLTVIPLFTFAQKITREQYLQKYKNIAISEMKRSGVPASITLAQGMLESDNGNSTLAVKANNHFGIKCHNGWQGETFTHDDDRPNECFRKYKNAEQSFRDHSDFLTTHSRYAFLFELKTTDYKGWAKGLKKAGYATNRQYAHLLIKIIEENNLARFDSKRYKPTPETISQPEPVIAGNTQQPLLVSDENSINPFQNNVKQNNRIDYVLAQQGDTYESIAERHGLMPWQLYKYNETTKGVQPYTGDIVYLQPKRRKADVKHKQHVVKPGETMYSISQMYGVKLKHMYRINSIEFGHQPEIGNVVSLRKKIKRNN